MKKKFGRRDRKSLLFEGLENRNLMAADLLVSTTVGSDQVLQSYDPSGALVSSQAIPTGGATAEKARDLIAGDGGDIHIFNGTNSPYLSTIDSNGSWDHVTTSGWSTFSSSYYGGIGKHENFVFVTDMWGGGAASPKGIVRFDVDNGSATRFDNFYSYTDLTVGHDGLVYAQSHRTVRVYDPDTLALQRTVNLPFSIGGQSQVYRGIAVDSSGEIFAASWQNQIHRFDANGNVLASSTVSSPGGLFGDFTDIDLSDDGRLALGTYWGYIVQMNDDFSGTSYIDTGNSSVFVAFGESSEPSLPSVSISDVQVTEGDSGLVVAQFDVTLSEPSDSQVHVLHETQSGSATSGVDFAPVNSALTFFPGETEKTINVFVHGDQLDENDEHFEVLLTQAFGATLQDDRATGTILDDDFTVVPDLSIGNTSVNENAGSASFVVALSEPSSAPVVFDYATRNGSASEDIDFISAGGTVTIAPGEISAEVLVDLVDDAVDEMTETFYLDIANAQGANVADGSGLAFLYDDDTAFLSVSDVTVSEGDIGTTTADFLVSLSTPSAFIVRVDYDTQAGSASAGSDFTDISGQLTFAPGETEKTVSVPVLGDIQEEQNETFDLLLSSPFFAAISDSSGTAEILDDDETPVTISIGDKFASERFGDEFGFLVSLSGASTTPVSVEYSTSLNQGSAEEDVDFAATQGSLTFLPGETEQMVFVQVYDDSIDELTETFYIDLQNPIGASLADGTGEGIIADEDRSLLEVSSPQVEEGDSGTQMFVFDVSLSLPVSRDVDVQYATEDFTATSGEDYSSVAGTLTFLAGETQKTVSVPVFGDTLNEANELFLLEADALISFEQNETSGTAQIVNDDFPTISVGDSQVIEGQDGSRQMFFTLNLSNPSEVAAGVSFYTVNQTAIAGQDYVASSGNVMFSPLQTTATISITILGDQVLESNEEFLLVLHQNLGANLSQSVVTGTIIDDD